MKKIKSLLFTSLLMLFSANLFGYTFFSGYAGGKVDYKADSSSYDPDLGVQAFFAGQFNFSENTWGRMEFSVTTDDILSFSLFEEDNSINAAFQFDELSFITRSIFNNNFNYFSAYMGTYDPVGSDLFLQRYFGITTIQSKLTDSWLGMSGSIIYPHFGMGISDVIRFNESPMALGGYVYVNKNNSFILNVDARYAGVFRYFTYDITAGVGIPLSNKYEGSDVIAVVDTLDIHTGATVLIGNNYTNSLFLQGGIKADINKSRDPAFQFAASDTYILIEPRFLINSCHFNITAYSLPPLTAAKMLNVNDTFGLNFNLYLDTIAIRDRIFTAGSHLCLSLPDKSFADLPDLCSPAILQTIMTFNFNVYLTPYVSTTLFNGTLHGQAKIGIIDFIRTPSSWYNAFSVDVGYKCKL